MSCRAVSLGWMTECKQSVGSLLSHDFICMLNADLHVLTVCFDWPPYTTARSPSLESAAAFQHPYINTIYNTKKRFIVQQCTRVFYYILQF